MHSMTQNAVLAVKTSTAASTPVYFSITGLRRSHLSHRSNP